MRRFWQSSKTSASTNASTSWCLASRCSMVFKHKINFQSWYKSKIICIQKYHWLLNFLDGVALVLYEVMISFNMMRSIAITSVWYLNYSTRIKQHIIFTVEKFTSIVFRTSNIILINQTIGDIWIHKILRGCDRWFFYWPSGRGALFLYPQIHQPRWGYKSDL